MTTAYLDGHSARLACPIRFTHAFRTRCFLVLTASVALFSCRKPDSGIGLGLQPEGELIDLRTDTLPTLEMVPVTL